jgi:hypothetical protein
MDILVFKDSILLPKRRLRVFFGDCVRPGKTLTMTKDQRMKLADLLKEILETNAK